MVMEDRNSEVVYCCNINSDIESKASRSLVHKYREPVPTTQKQYDWKHGPIIHRLRKTTLTQQYLEFTWKMHLQCQVISHNIDIMTNSDSNTSQLRIQDFPLGGHRPVGGVPTSDAYAFQQKCMWKRKNWILLGGARQRRPPGSASASCGKQIKLNDCTRNTTAFYVCNPGQNSVQISPR